MRKYLFIFGIILFAMVIKMCNNKVEPVSRFDNEEYRKSQEPNSISTFEEVDLQIEKTNKIRDSILQIKSKTDEEKLKENEIEIKFLEQRYQTERDPKKKSEIALQIMNLKVHQAHNPAVKKTKIDISDLDNLKKRVEKIKTETNVKKDSI